MLGVSAIRSKTVEIVLVQVGYSGGEWQHHPIEVSGRSLLFGRQRKRFVWYQPTSIRRQRFWLSKQTQSRITGLPSTTLSTKRALFLNSNIRKSVKDNLGNAWRIGVFIQILAQSARNSLPSMQWS
jgi:hypothetical protein